LRNCGTEFLSFKYPTHGIEDGSVLSIFCLFNGPETERARDYGSAAAGGLPGRFSESYGGNVSDRQESPSMPQICITSFDMECLRGLITRSFRVGVETKDLVRLQEVLDLAEVVSTPNLPEKIVTLDSKFKVKDLDYRKEQILTIVLPVQADTSRHKISILAPLGTSMLGRKVGDTIEVEVPAGTRTFRIEEILHQPEMAKLRNSPASKRRRNGRPARGT
jgi:regulator of nucleoside diphosphate kinase